MEESVHNITSFCDFNDIHFEKYLSALSIGQIGEKLCHLILKAYGRSIISGTKAEVIIYYWTLIRKICLETSSSTSPPRVCLYCP